MPLREIPFRPTSHAEVEEASCLTDSLYIIICPSLRQLSEPNQEAELAAWRDLNSLFAVRSIYVHVPEIDQDPILNYVNNESGDNLRKNATDLLKSINKLQLPSYARLVFVGYSFGSGIVKDAMVCSNNLSPYITLLNRTTHIIFIGAINNEKDPDFDTAFSNCALCECGLNLDKKNFTILRSPLFIAQMRALCKDFEEFIRPNTTTAYYGNQKASYTKSRYRFWAKKREFVISRSLASITGSDGKTIEVACDHRDLSGFTLPGSNLALEIKAALQDIAKKYSSTAQHSIPASLLHSQSMSMNRNPRMNSIISPSQSIRSQKTGQVPWNISRPCFYMGEYQPNPAFTGRDEILRSIEDALAPGKSPGQQSKMALIGMPGMGKTQIALQYAFESKNSNRYDIILFAQAETRAKLTTSFVKFDEELELQAYAPMSVADSQTGSRERVKHFLRQTSAHWLLIFDNFEKRAVEGDEMLDDFLPTGNKGSILITARTNSSLRFMFRATTTINNISGLSAEDSVNLLFKISGIQDIDENRQYAKKIYERIAGHPLSLTTIAYIVSTKQLDFKEYIDLFPNDRLFGEAEDIEAKDIFGPEAHYEHNLPTVFLTALSGIEAIVGHGDARGLLELLSFLDPDGVNEQDLAEGSIGSDLPVLQGIADPRWLEKTRSLLCKNNIVNRNLSLKRLMMHRMMQDYCRYRMTTDSAKAAFEGAFRLIHKLWPVPERHNRHQPGLWPTQERLANHVIRLADHWETSQKVDKPINATIEFAELLHNCAWYFYERGNYPSALPLLRIAEFYCQKNPENCQVVKADIYGVYGGRHSECNEAQACFDTFSKQHELIQEAIRLGLLQRPNVREALAEGGIGVGKMALGKYAEAEVAFHKCLKIWEECPGDPSIYIPHLGVCLTLQGKLDEAEKLLTDIIEAREKQFGKKDRTSFRTGIIYLAYGNLQIQQQRFEAAYQTHLSAAEMLAETVGKSHHRYADACYKIAWHQCRRNELDAAKETLTSALSVYRSSDVFKNEEARVLFKFGEIEAKDGKENDAKKWREAAEKIRHGISQSKYLAVATEKDYDELIMFWSR